MSIKKLDIEEELNMNLYLKIMDKEVQMKKNIIKFVYISILTTLLLNCGGGGASEEDDPENVSSYTVTATPGYKSIELTWETFGDSTNDYEILRIEGDDGFSETIDTVGSYSTSYIDQNAEYGVSYKYKLIQVNTKNETRYSNLVSVLPLDKPVEVKVEKSGFTGLIISFTAISINEKHSIEYDIERSTDNSTFTKIGSVSNYYWSYTANQALSYSDTSINPDITYYYRIVSRDYYESSYFSISVSGEGRMTRPAIPADLAVSTTSGMTLTWSSVENVAGYKVYRSADNVTYTEIKAITPSTTLTYTDTTCGPGVTYYYMITSYSGSNESEKSGSITGNVATGNFTPGQPSASSNSSTFTVSWAEVPGVDSYRVFYSTTDTGTYTQSGGDITGTSTTSIVPPTEEDFYYWKIAVVKGGVESIKSESTPGRKVKYNPDVYEQDDSASTAKIINLYGTTAVTQNHTLDTDDDTYGDYYIVYNKYPLSKKIRITFTELDLNGNSSITWSSSNTENITGEGYIESGSTISPNYGWSFRVYTGGLNYKTSKYTISVQLVD